MQLAPSPLQLLSVRQPAKEQMLFEVNAKGHIRFDRPADTRKDSVAVHVLRDRHSLAADLRDLEREQAALKKRVSKLRIQDVLPFRVAALQKSMVNQTTLALTAMAPKHSAPVPLKVYQASFVVKVRVVPAQPALSCASPLPELSLRPCPSVWAAAEQGKTAALQTAVLYDVVCCCEMLCMDGVH